MNVQFIYAHVVTDYYTQFEFQPLLQFKPTNKLSDIMTEYIPVPPVPYNVHEVYLDRQKALIRIQELEMQSNPHPQFYKRTTKLIHVLSITPDEGKHVTLLSQINTFATIDPPLEQNKSKL